MPLELEMDVIKVPVGLMCTCSNTSVHIVYFELVERRNSRINNMLKEKVMHKEHFYKYNVYPTIFLCKNQNPVSRIP